MTRRIEITVSEDVWVRLNDARGHEPRASFVKRALDEFLGVRSEGVGSRVSPASVAAPAGSSPARPPVAPVPGVRRAREVESPAMARQRLMNKAKGL